MYSIQQFATDLISFSFPIDRIPHVRSPSDIYINGNPLGITAEFDYTIRNKIHHFYVLVPSRNKGYKYTLHDYKYLVNFLLNEFLVCSDATTFKSIKLRYNELLYEELFNTKCSRIVSSEPKLEANSQISTGNRLSVTHMLGFRSSVKYLTFLGKLLKLCSGSMHEVYIKRTLNYIASTNSTTDETLRYKVQKDYDNWVVKYKDSLNLLDTNQYDLVINPEELDNPFV